MGELLEAGYDLGGLAACYVVIGFLSVVIMVLEFVVGVLDVPVFGTHPFKSLGDAITNSVIDGLEEARTSVSGIAGRFQNGLLQGLTLIIGIPLLLGLGLYKVFAYLWNSALPALLHFTFNPIINLANQALSEAIDASGAAAGAVAEAAAYTDSVADHTFSRAASYTATNIIAAIETADSYADQAVSKLRAVEDASVAEAERLARAGEKSVADAATAAVATVNGAVIGLSGDVDSLRKYLDSLGLAGLIATVPALLLLTNMLLQETGLENEACRSKVKGICGTNTTAWEDLLGGLALIGFGFSLKEMAEVARPLIGVLEPIIREAA